MGVSPSSVVRTGYETAVPIQANINGNRNQPNSMYTTPLTSVVDQFWAYTFYYVELVLAGVFLALLIVGARFLTAIEG